MTHRVSKITYLFALSLLLPLLAVFSSCGGEEPMPVAVKSVELNEYYLTLKVGESIRLEATVYPSDAEDQRVVWGSYDSDIADVDEQGYVTAYEVGSTIVCVQTVDGSYSAECQVEVLSNENDNENEIYIRVTDITLSDDSITLYVGDEYQLTAEISPSNATNKKLVWTSFDESIATVSDGKVIAIGEGTTDIFVGAEGYWNWDKCTVTVTVPKIKFADDHAKSWCVGYFDTNHDYEISYDEAAAVQDLKNYSFDENITTFDEFQYFINVTSIPVRFFADHGLESIILPKSIKSIKTQAFYQCSKLTKIELSEGLETIGDKAFYECSKLTKIEFPEGLETIGKQAFQWCTGLTRVYCKPLTPPVMLSHSYLYPVFGNDCRIYVPHNSIELYKVAEYWKDYEIVGYDF